MSLKKTTDKAAPHARFEYAGWTWNVLKTYQKPDKERANPYARWFCFVTSPMCPEGEYGDTYVRDVVGTARLTHASETFIAAYTDAMLAHHGAKAFAA